jgi:prepilin peptidase CpaA
MTNMVIELIILVGLALGSYTDLKTREIPDTLSFSLIFLGLATALGASIFFWSYKPLLTAALGFAAGAAVSLLAYYTGQWGGGDAKILMGIGSLIGVNVFAPGKEFPLLGLFLINLVLMGAAFGLLWILGLAARNWHKFREAFREARRKTNIVWLRVALLSLVVIFTVIAFVFRPNFIIITFTYLLLVFAALFLYLSIIIRTVEKTCLIKKIKTYRLTEGDWIVEKIKFKSRKEDRDAGKYIYTKTGITLEGIKLLKKSGKKTITVKEGMPFLPSFLLAYILTIAVGYWLPF